jgi:glycogen operon protein
VPPGLRGTYAGFVHDAALEHLVGLGVTSVELLPVFESVTEPALARRGHTNYWGYNTIGFFAPHGAYSAAVRSGRVGGQVDEFRMMVERLHAAGLEVILDVVYNHTAEGDAVGPTLSLRGLDNAAYYRLEPSDPSAYVDTTGTGNSVRADHPRALRLIMDSLRYWIEEMGVDGFRFDLAATLARDHDVFDRESAFLDAVAQDPVVSQVKLIAEPWDVGRPDSYGLGRFPAPWAEWNGAYRDCVRDFWRSRDGMLGEFAGRLTGSADLYGSPPGRSPGSVNFVTAHDGFTLRDLVSYDVKHNETNGEGNRDGTDDNRSWNCGVEGATDDPVVLALRARQSRAMLATLVCSFGVPMLAGGDELGRTQLGNNNAYCHDDELAWFDWDDVDTDLLRFVRALLAWRQRHPVFRRRRSLGGPAVTGIDWFAADGARMAPAGWSDPSARSVTLFLDGSQGVGEDDGSAVDDDFLVVVNAWWEPLEVVIPDTGAAREWRTALDTFSGQVVDDAPGPMGPDATARLSAGERRSVGARSLVVLTTG